MAVATVAASAAYSPTAAATASPAAAPDPVSPGNRYDAIQENPFLSVAKAPLSTFSIDVDTASYAIVRSYLSRGAMPPADAVRIEEMINYFGYRYPEPVGDAPLRVDVASAAAPWAPEHVLVRVAVKGKTVSPAKMDGVNLVFLVDTSGSMNEPNKLPLVKYGMRKLVDALQPSDRVAVVAYAGSAGLVLPSTPVREKQAVLGAIDRLESGGSTNGGAGIQLAYDVAAQGFMKGGVNRVILATDGDFNVGLTGNDALVELVQQKAKTGVFLSVLGFGMGNLNDSLLEKIADKGNGMYAYIDNEQEAKRALVDGLGSLVTIAKDVKIQVEFDPAEAESYRLIGYENRVMASRDFHDDEKDAGELGSGHTVTALYELVPKGGSMLGGRWPSAGTVRLRYKAPDGSTSKMIETELPGLWLAPPATGDLQFAAAVASFGMLLRGSKHAGTATWDSVLALAEKNAGDDPARREMVQLIRTARGLARR
jgi:Ca-activated chloride channel family protein